MIHKIKFLFLASVISLIFPFASVMAATPTLTLSTQSEGNNVQLSVAGDPNQSILLSYVKTGIGSQVDALGTTNGAGNWSGTVSTSAYNIATNSSVYVTLGGVNGQRSSSVAWPTSSAQTTTGSTFTLSPTGVVLTIGQTSTITASNSGTNYLYLSNNSNPQIANVNISGTQITIFANSQGSTVATVCAVGNSANCGSIYITVQNSASAPLTFSQNSVTIAAGQNVPITISGGTGIYMVQNNSNSGAVQTNMNGNVITLSTSSTGGLSSITVCSTNLATCGIINVTVGSVSTAPLSFDKSNPALRIGESTTVTVSGGPTGSVYYLSSNQNTNVATATMPTNSATITLTGVANGSSLITICSSLGNCSSFTVTVSYVSSGGTLALSQTSMSLLVGQTLSVTISGGTTPYSLLNPTSSVATASLNGNVLSVSGTGAGTAIVTVCSAGAACVGLSLTVSGIGTVAAPTFSPTSVSTTVGQTVVVGISGNGGYHVSSNNSPTAASVQINGSTAVVYGIGAGGTNALICQNGGQCSTLTVSVAAAVSTASVNTAQTTNTTPTTTTTISVPVYEFTKYLATGSESSEVLQLQKLLVKLGFLTATPNGYFGNATKAALMKFQKKNGLDSLGIVGPATRKALNEITENTTTKTTQAATKCSVVFYRY